MNQTVDLDLSSAEPLYSQLYRSLADQIMSGEIAAGEFLPSKRTLCEELKISHSTVETAYALLLAEGYVESEPRRGYRVLEVVDLPSAQETHSREMESPREEKRILEFSTGAVDTTEFPYASWARLYRDILYTYPDLLTRGSGQGDRELRSSLAAFLARYRNVRCSEEQIVIGAGVSVLLDILLQLVPSPVIAMEDPGYPTVKRAALSHGRQIEPIPVDEKGLVVSELRKREGVDLCFVTPSHQYPTGVTMTIGRRTQLLDWADKNKAYIIEDDYDSEFRYSTRPIGALQGIDQMGRVIYIGTFSRSIAPSIRVAYMVLPKQLLEEYRSRFAGSSCTVSRLEQQVVARFIDQGLHARHVRRCTRLYKERKEYLERLLLETFPGATITGNEAGLHFLLHLPGIDGQRLRERAEEQGLRLQILDWERGAKGRDGCIFVIGFAGLSKEAADENVRILKSCL